jgi:hypothetical protein
MATAVAIAVMSSGLNSTCGAATNKGTLIGSLRIFGGVAFQPRDGWPTAGRVEFKPATGTARAIKVGRSGQFTVELKPGTYTVFGGPPAWRNTCQGNNGKPFNLSAGQTVHVTVSCVAI